MNRNGASPRKHWTPIASPSNNLIHCKESHPWAAAKSSKNLSRARDIINIFYYTIIHLNTYIK